MTSSACYTISKFEGIDQLTKSTVQVPQPKRGQVLVRIHAVSLNYRDLMVAKGLYPGSKPSDLIPCSDGAGEVVQIGEDVSEFQIGDRVCGTFFQKWHDGPIPSDSWNYTLGGSLHGVLSQYVTFEKGGVIKFPSHLSYEEASTLPCAALTAWNALNSSHKLGPGQSVLVLGTGGVSIFAIQFAAAAGARVIVTSSSEEKLQKAKALGATDLINYTTFPNWNEKVLEITNGQGVDHIVEIGGAGTIEQSLNSVKVGGSVYVIGSGGLSAENPAAKNIPGQVLFRAVTLRGILIGSYGMFESMNRALEANKIHPVVDKVFSFNEVQDAYHYLESQKHVGKVVIRVD